jgi:hypothetical protein
MSFPFSPYLSQILMELLKFFISLQRIKISIYVRKVREVILYGKFYNKRLVATGLDRFLLRCGPIRTGPKRSGYGTLISGSVYTGCGCQLPRFEAKNRTGLDFKTLNTPKHATCCVHCRECNTLWEPLLFHISPAGHTILHHTLLHSKPYDNEH